MLEVKIKLEGGICPNKATAGSAAYDVSIPQEVKVIRGRQVIPLGFSIELPKGYQAMIEPRSGFSSKGIIGYSLWDNATLYSEKRYDCDVINGKIDSDYRGIVGVIVNNHDSPFKLAKGTRIAQMTIQKVESVNFIEVSKLEETERSNSGFGSTGTKM